MFGLAYHIHVILTSGVTLRRSSKYLSQFPPPSCEGERVRTPERVTMKTRKCG